MGLGIWSLAGLALKAGAKLDLETASFDVSENSGGAGKMNSVRCPNFPFNVPMDDDLIRFDDSFNVSRFGQNQKTARPALQGSLDGAVETGCLLEKQGALDFSSLTENVDRCFGHGLPFDARLNRGLV
jgi:hypothetical protein